MTIYEFLFLIFLVTITYLIWKSQLEKAWAKGFTSGYSRGKSDAKIKMFMEGGEKND